MRIFLAVSFGCLLLAATVSPALAAAKPSVSPALLAKVEQARKTRLRPAFPDALLELATAYRAAGRLKEAHAAAREAAGAYDAQLELHHELSEAVSDPVRGRAERAAAHELGQARDKARFLAAEIARQMGDENLAIPDYVLVARSQPEEALGRDALTALGQLGWLHAPLAEPKP